MNNLLRRQWTLSVEARLLLGLVPSLLAVAMVAGLVYWGEYGRQAPHAVMAIAAVLAALTLAMTLWNVRYLVRRFDRITEMVGSEARRASPDSSEAADAFDQIEEVMGHLGSALTKAELARVRADMEGSARLKEQSTLLAALVRDSIARLDDVRLPLHILLESKFGEVNENQEELLRDARGASDDMDAALRRLGAVAEADRDALPVTRELVQVNDVVRAILPLIRASAERRGARVEVELEPAMPRVLADRSRLAEALSLIATMSTGAEVFAHTMTVSTRRHRGGVVVEIKPLPSGGMEGLSAALAERLVRTQGGEMKRTADGLLVMVGTAPDQEAKGPSL